MTLQEDQQELARAWKELMDAMRAAWEPPIRWLLERMPGARKTS